MSERAMLLLLAIITLGGCTDCINDEMMRARVGRLERLVEQHGIDLGEIDYKKDRGPAR